MLLKIVANTCHIYIYIYNGMKLMIIKNGDYFIT